MPLNLQPDSFVEDNHGVARLQFYYGEEEAKRNTRAYLTTILGALKCRTDVQLADGKGMLAAANTNRWRNHVFGNTERPTDNNVLTYFYRSDRGSSPVLLRRRRGSTKHPRVPNNFLGALNCRTDVQLADGKGMLLKYVSFYVTKMHEAATSEGLYCTDLTGFQAAHSFLRTVRPLEPEMVFQLSNIHVCWTDKLTKQFKPPFPDQTDGNTVYQLCLRRPPTEEDLPCG